MAVPTDTPFLSPTSSATESPVFSERLESPSLPALDIGSGHITPQIISGTATPLPVQDTKKQVIQPDGKVIKIPECWGHRGVCRSWVP